MVRKKSVARHQSLGGPTMDQNLVMVLVLIGSQMISGQDIPKAVECFSSLNKVLRLYTDKIDPVACRFPSKTRKGFVPPSVEDILRGKTLTDVSEKFTKECDSKEDGVVTQQEVSELMGVQTDLNSWNVLALLETGVKCAEDAGLGEEDTKLVGMAFESFMELLNTTIADVINQSSGGAICSDNSECGKGECHLLMCMCGDNDYTGKRCNIEKLNDTKFAQPPLTDAEAAVLDGCVSGLKNTVRNQLTILNPIICKFKLKLKDEMEHSAIRLPDSKEGSTTEFHDATKAKCDGLTTADTLDEAKRKIASVTDAFKNDFFIALENAKACVETSGAFKYPAEVGQEMKKYLSRLVLRIHDLADELLEKSQGGYCRNDTDCGAGKCNASNKCMCYTDTWGRRCLNGTFDIYAKCDKCFNGGSCVFKNGTFSSCMCTYPWTGIMCNVYMRGPSDCSKCLNGGSCLFDSETCYCRAGFMGRFCEFDIAGLLTNLTSTDIDTADKCLETFRQQVQTLVSTINDILCQTSSSGNMFRIPSVKDIVSALVTGMNMQSLLMKNCVRNNVQLTPEDMKTKLIGAFRALNASLQSNTISSAMKCLNDSISDQKVVRILRHLYSDIINATSEAGRILHHKPGMCPAVTATTFGVCVTKCTGDSDCPFDHKCCSNGCGQVCLPPVTGVERPSMNLTAELKKGITVCIQGLNEHLQGVLADVNKVLCQMGIEYPSTHMSAMAVIDDFSSPMSLDSSCKNVPRTIYTHAEMMKVLSEAAATLTSNDYLDELTKAKACIVSILPATTGNVSESFDHLYGAVSGAVSMILSAGSCISMPCKNSGSCVPQGTGYMCSCSALYTGKNCETPFVDPKLPSSLTREEKDAIKTCIDEHEKNLTDALDNGNLREKVKCAALLGLTQFQGSWSRKPSLNDIYNEPPTSTSGETKVTLSDCIELGYVNTSDGSFAKEVMEKVQALYGYLNSYEGLADLDNGVACLMNVLKDSGRTEDENAAMQARMRAFYDDFSASVKADVAPYMYGMAPTGYCLSHPCQNGGSCVQSKFENGFICECPSGVKGDNCETTDDKDPCMLKPCKNLGSCSPQGSDYECFCSALYTGKNCETPLAPTGYCLSHPCQNGGSCVQSKFGNRFICECPSGVKGDNCETPGDKDPCMLKPCQNLGSCSPQGSDYECFCSALYTGKNCETPLDPCMLKPCQNLGSCSPQGSDYECFCSALYTGKNCETPLECSYDCDGVCDGTATLDCGSRCSGGDTGVTPKVKDACDVCDGDGTSCIAVTAVRPTLFRTDQDRTLAVTGTSLSSASVQCVVKATGSTTEHRVPITSRSDVTSIDVNIEAYSLEAGEYTLYCRVTATAALGASSGTFTVYEASEATGNPTCVITGPTTIDTCADLLMSGVSSRGGGIYGLTYAWIISPNTRVTFTEPQDGYASWTGLVAGTYTVTLTVCTIFDTCSTCQETVTKTSDYTPEVSIETVVDITAAPANREFELFGFALPSECSGAPSETDLTYRWTFSEGVKVNADRQDDQVYQVRARDFPPGQTITVTLTASLASDSSVSASRELTIVVASSELEVYIDGGEERTASVNSGLLVFDGSYTQDPDDPTAELLYAWSATGRDSSGKDIGSCVEPGSSTSSRLSIDPSLFSAGTQCAVMLTVTAGDKSGTRNVTFDIVSGTSPVCFASNNRPKLRPGDRTVVVVSCTSSVDISDTVWSSQTRGDAKALDLDVAVADQYTDALPDNTYRMFLVIGKDIIQGGNKYNLQATITDVNGGQTKTTVILNVMRGLSGGQLTCPSSYTELRKISITTRKVNSDGGLTYMLLVQSSTGQYKALSQKQSTGDFSVTGPRAYTGAGNIFHVEVCVVGENDMCKTLSCMVPTVNADSGTDAMVAAIKAEINQLKSQSRSMEAAVLLGTLYGKTAESSLPAELVSLVNDIATKRTMNDASASTFLDILTSVPPQAFTAGEFDTIASQIRNVADYFINNDVKVPERYLARLNDWIIDAEVAGASSTVIATVEAKADLAATSGIEYGNSATYDLTSSRLSVVNDIPGDNMKIKDGSNNDVKINFGESVRSQLGYKNVVIKVTSFKTSPPAVTQSSSAIAPIIDISFVDPSSNKEKSITGLQKPASISLALNSDQVNQGQGAQCVFWDATTNTWSFEGVTTSLQSGTTMECKTVHFTTYTVIHAYKAYNDDHNVGMIVGVVLGIIILMIVIILLMILICYKCTRNKVLDSSRANSRMNNTNRRNSRPHSRVHVSDDSPHRLVDSPNDKRPGSGDGLKRSIN